jgi:NTP pyrophosphatase (non-canonical NTP hydrolase)
LNDATHCSNPVAQRARKFREERGDWGTHAESLCAEVERLAGIAEIAHADSLSRALAAAELQNEQLRSALLNRVCGCGLADRNPEAHSGSCDYKAVFLTSASRPDPAADVTQSAVLAWAVRSFGPVAKNRDERAARLVEEAAEIAQVEGVPLEVVCRIAGRVYSRPPGELGQEIGGLGITLLALAENAGIDCHAEVRREFRRVLSKPPAWWKHKHAEKVAAGTADLSPPRCAALEQSR